VAQVQKLVKEVNSIKDNFTKLSEKLDIGFNNLSKHIGEQDPKKSKMLSKEDEVIFRTIFFYINQSEKY
jgi:hypothetical protein